MGVGERVLELEDVADVGAAEAVDRLGVVADDHQVPPLLGQQLQPAVLGVVGVLVLVDEHVAERAGVVVAHLLEQLEHVDRAHEQVVEVHRVHAVHLALVGPVDVGHRLLEERAHHLRIRIGVAQLVLGVGDLVVDRRRREPLGVDPELVEAALDQPPRVGLVVDREPARVPELVGVGAEHPGAGGVERHHPHRADPAADQQLGAVAHLPRRLVRERDREDLVRLGRVGRDQIGDPVGEHAGLARPGAGQDQQRPLAVRDGLPLGVVQAGEKGLELGGGVGHGSIFNGSGGGGRFRPRTSCFRGRARPPHRAPIRLCAVTANSAATCAIDPDRTSAYVGTLPVDLPAPEPDPEAHVTTGTREELAAFWLTLDAINFGSGWFPTLRKRDGRSGYYTVATGVRDRFAEPRALDRRTTWPRSTPHEIANTLGQDPDHELMGLFARSLNDLGQRVATDHGGRFARRGRRRRKLGGRARRRARGMGLRSRTPRATTGSRCRSSSAPRSRPPTSPAPAWPRSTTWTG